MKRSVLLPVLHHAAAELDQSELQNLLMAKIKLCQELKTIVQDVVGRRYQQRRPRGRQSPPDGPGQAQVHQQHQRRQVQITLGTQQR